MHENYCDTIEDGCDAFFLTTAASVLTTIGSLISAASAIALIHVIHKSSHGFSTVYHRIMSNMAFFDLLSSIAISFSTFLMPKDVIYPFEGRRVYGNVATCEAQSFLFVFGMTGSFVMLCGLHIYYVANIQFKISDQNLQKYLLPCILLIAWSFSALLSITFLVKDVYNPVYIETWCSVSKYPFNCESTDCIRGGDAFSTSTMVIALIGCVCLGLINILVCMTVIILGAWKKNEYFFPNGDNPKPRSVQDRAGMNTGTTMTTTMLSTTVDPQNASSDENALSMSDVVSAAWLRIRRILIRQACCYFLAFFMTWVFAVSSLLVRQVVSDVLYCIFFPLQGFFNLVVFASHKVHNIKRIDPNITLWQALNIMFFHPKHMPDVKFSGLSKVSHMFNLEMVDYRLSPARCADIVLECESNRISSVGAHVSSGGEGFKCLLSDEISSMFEEYSTCNISNASEFRDGKEKIDVDQSQCSNSLFPIADPKQMNLARMLPFQDDSNFSVSISDSSKTFSLTLTPTSIMKNLSTSKNSDLNESTPRKLNPMLQL